MGNALVAPPAPVAGGPPLLLEEADAASLAAHLRRSVRDRAPCA